jgi:hypothetical protein
VQVIFNAISFIQPRLFESLIMPKYIAACFLASFSVIFSGFLYAQVPTQESESSQEMNRIQNILAVINAEIKSDLDQLLILQEALKSNARMSLEAQGRSPDVVNMTDLANAQRQAIERETSINARIDAVLARTAELSLKKQSLLEQFMELSALPLPSAANGQNKAP